MSLQSQVLRAPNEKFYVLWRGQPICLMGGVLYYFETEREARALRLIFNWTMSKEYDAEGIRIGPTTTLSSTKLPYWSDAMPLSAG